MHPVELSAHEISRTTRALSTRSSCVPPHAAGTLMRNTPAWRRAVMISAGTDRAVGTLLAEQAGADRSTEEDGLGVLAQRLLAYVEERLADPGLSPEGIAAAHRISRRCPHKLLAAQGHTVSGWIREQRLDRCRRDLADPAMDHLPVGAIGGRCGLFRPGPLQPRLQGGLRHEPPGRAGGWTTASTAVVRAPAFGAAAEGAGDDDGGRTVLRPCGTAGGRCPQATWWFPQAAW